jgi:hypothetical protein
VGRLKPNAGERQQAGDLCPIEAIDREGLVVTRDGALVRVLRAAPKNPLVMGPAEREHIGRAFGQLTSRLRAGQSMQFYVEAAPVRLDDLLAQSHGEASRAWSALTDAPHRAAALRRLHDAMRESLERHCGEQAAVDVAYYAVIPYIADQRTRVDWRQLLPGRRRRLATAALERSLASHRRIARESLQLTDAIRGDLEALDLSTHLLSGPEVLDLFWRRFNPTTADRTPERRPGAREDRLEIVGALDAAADARSAARAAHALREAIASRVSTGLTSAISVLIAIWSRRCMSPRCPTRPSSGGCSTRCKSRGRSRSRSTSMRSTGCASGRGSRRAIAACSASTAARSFVGAHPTTRCSPRRRNSANSSRNCRDTSDQRRSRSRSISPSASAARTPTRSSSPRQSSRPRARSWLPATHA